MAKAGGLPGVWGRIYLKNFTDKNLKSTVTDDLLLSSTNAKSSCIRSHF